jgi:hypothetical protein
MMIQSHHSSDIHPGGRSGGQTSGQLAIQVVRPSAALGERTDGQKRNSLTAFTIRLPIQSI